MSKRIKRVFTSGSQVLHLWANQSQSDARTKNVYFDGLKCWSYGSHYELGRLVEFRGVRVALINDTGYSVTTNKHINWAYGASENMVRFKTTELMSGHDTRKLIIDAIIRRRGELVSTFFNEFNSRKYRWSTEFNVAPYLSEYGDEEWIVREVREFNKNCKTLGLNKYVLDINWMILSNLIWRFAKQHGKRSLKARKRRQSVRRDK